MKKFLKILGIIVGAIIFIIILAMVFTSGLPKSADALFSDIKAGNIEQAYTSTAKEFQAATSLDQFTAFVTQTKLTNIQKASWTEREVNNNQGLLKGTLTLNDGTKIPFEIQLLKEDGIRKIYNMGMPQGGIDDTQNTSIPSQTETTVLVHKAMELLANAINKGDFTSFYANIAKVRQDQTTAQDLLGAFQVFVDNKIDFSFTTTMEPNYTAVPTIDDNGVLLVQGTFAAQDGTVVFEQKFYQENNERKLFGINVQIK